VKFPVSDVSTPILIGSLFGVADGGCDAAVLGGAAVDVAVADGLGDAPPAQPAMSRATAEEATSAALRLRISIPLPAYEPSAMLGRAPRCRSARSLG
jgi:hypothetical protein